MYKFAIVTQWQLGMRNGALFGVPIPEKYEAVGKALQEAVEVALTEAEQNGVNKRGKEATPWLLKRVGELTEGTSLSSSKWFCLYVISRSYQSTDLQMSH